MVGVPRITVRYILQIKFAAFICPVLSWLERIMATRTDLTHGGDIIRGITFSAFMPLIAVALIYLPRLLPASNCPSSTDMMPERTISAT